jgi:hypothetical protein
MRRRPRVSSLAAAALYFSLASTASADDPKLAAESYMIPSADPGIQLYIRNKHPVGVATLLSPQSIPSKRCRSRRSKKSPITK